jgi:hypothetical protein
VTERAEDEYLRERAKAAADRAVEAMGSTLSQAFESGNVIAIEETFYRVFHQIYLEGWRDGREGQ